MKLNNPDVLLVDDNPADILITTKAFEEINPGVKVRAAQDGHTALEYLDRCEGFEGSPLPKLILLDLNLPGMNGLEVLENVRSRPALRSVPVIILSSSAHQRDVEKAYRFGANSYITKPLSWDDFREVVAGIHNFWLNLVRYPEASTSLMVEVD
ncbi:MAG TPA: response regulator [Calditrichia bacterium]|nr:response regulator [Calditrichota bacterium]HQV31664.1 response regulator [Calditrichia bacterium]